MLITILVSILLYIGSYINFAFNKLNINTKVIKKAYHANYENPDTINEKMEAAKGTGRPEENS